MYHFFRRALLKKWKELNGDDATYGKLLRLCCKNDLQSLAEAVCYMLRSRVCGEFILCW